MVPATTSSRLAYRTTALGTRAELLVTDDRALATAIGILEAELERIDRAASRFRSDSELSRVHRAGGDPIVVSDGLFEAIRVALGAATATDGAVDPTVGPALCRLGYDRDFADVAGGRDGTLPEPQPVPGWRAVEIDESRGTVRLPPGVELDLGATAKALAADRVADRVGRTCGCGVLVSLGGDIATAGVFDGFAVGLDGTCGMAVGDETVLIGSGGLATSGTAARRWRLGRDRVHHIVDPATGLPAREIWQTVTVCAGSCVAANAASTAAVVMGAAAPRWLRARALPARLVSPDGHVVVVGGWPGTDDGSADGTEGSAETPGRGWAGT